MIVVAAALDLLDFTRHAEHVGPALIGGHFQRLLVLFLVEKEPAAFEAHAAQDLVNGVQVLVVEHRHGKLNSAKVPRSVHVIQPVGGAQHAGLGHPHVGAKQPAEHGLVSNVGVATRDFGYGAFSDFFGREYAKLNSHNF